MELRLAAVCHAVFHHDHISQMVSSHLNFLCIFSCVNFQFKAEISAKEDAQQFLATVSSEDQYDNLGPQKTYFSMHLKQRAWLLQRLVVIQVLNIYTSFLSLQLIVYFVKGYSKYYSLLELQHLQLNSTLSYPEMDMTQQYFLVDAQKISREFST